MVEYSVMNIHIASDFEYSVMNIQRFHGYFVPKMDIILIHDFLNIPIEYAALPID